MENGGTGVPSATPSGSTVWSFCSCKYVQKNPGCEGVPVLENHPTDLAQAIKPSKGYYSSNVQDLAEDLKRFNVQVRVCMCGMPNEPHQTPKDLHEQIEQKLREGIFKLEGARWKYTRRLMDLDGKETSRIAWKEVLKGQNSLAAGIYRLLKELHAKQVEKMKNVRMELGTGSSPRDNPASSKRSKHSNVVALTRAHQQVS